MGFDFTGVSIGGPTGLSPGDAPATLASLIGEAKGWYDVKTPGNLKTDIVAKFDSANAEALIGNSTGQSGEFAWSLWATPAILGSAKWLLFSGGNSAVNGVSLTINTGGTIQMRTKSSVTALATTSGPIISAGTLVNIIVTRDALDVVRLFVNGSLAAQRTVIGDMTGASGVSLGRIGAASNAMDGTLAKAGFWGRNLTQPEAVALYRSGIAKSYYELSSNEKIGIVHYWNLDEPRGLRYDSHSANHLADDNTVGAANGPTEYIATEHAGVTKWINTGGNASPFGDVTAADPNFAPVVNASGIAEWSGTAVGLQALVGGLSQPNTIVIVATLDIALASAYFTDAGGATDRQVVFVSSSKFQIDSGSGEVGSLASDASRNIIVAFFNDPASDLTVSGVVSASSEASGPDDLVGLTIGSRYSLTAPITGTIEAVIGLDRELTAPEIAALTAYFA